LRSRIAKQTVPKSEFHIDSLAIVFHACNGLFWYDFIVHLMRNDQFTLKPEVFKAIESFVMAYASQPGRLPTNWRPICPITMTAVANPSARVSVVAPNVTTADALATAVMVMGNTGLHLVENMAGCDAFVITKASKVLKTSGFWQG
jgi:hypothetical protein